MNAKSFALPARAGVLGRTAPRFVEAAAHVSSCLCPSSDVECFAPPPSGPTAAQFRCAVEDVSRRYRAEHIARGAIWTVLEKAASLPSMREEGYVFASVDKWSEMIRVSRRQTQRVLRKATALELLAFEEHPGKTTHYRWGAVMLDALRDATCPNLPALLGESAAPEEGLSSNSCARLELSRCLRRPVVASLQLAAAEAAARTVHRRGARCSRRFAREKGQYVALQDTPKAPNVAPGGDLLPLKLILIERSDSSLSLTPAPTDEPTNPVLPLEQKSVSPLPTPEEAPTGETLHALAVTIIAFYAAKAVIELRDVLTAGAIAMVQRCALDMLDTLAERQKRLKRVVESAFVDHRGDGYPTLGFIFGQLKYFRLRLGKLDAPLAKTKPKSGEQSSLEARSRNGTTRETTNMDAKTYGSGSAKSGILPRRTGGATTSIAEAQTNDEAVRLLLERVEAGHIDREIALYAVRTYIHKGGLGREMLLAVTRVFGDELSP